MYSILRPSPLRPALRGCLLALPIGLALPVFAAGPPAPAPPATPVAAAPAPAPASNGPEYDVYVTSASGVVEEVVGQRTIEPEVIEERTARTLDEALAFEPGIYVRHGNEGVPRVDMRGLRSRHVQLLLDGIPMQSTEDGQFDPALVPTEGLERVRVDFGNASVLHGDGPMAGVLQLETQRPEPGLHGTAGADFRSAKQQLGRVTLSGRHGDFDALAAGSVYDRFGIPLGEGFDTSGSEDGDIRDNARRDRRNLLFKSGWTPHANLRFGALLNGFEGEYQIPPNAIDGAGDPFASKPRYERVEDQAGYSGQFSMQWEPEGPIDVRSWVYANRLDEERTRYDDDDYDSIAKNGSYEAHNQSFVRGQATHLAADLGRFGRLRGVFQMRREDFATDGAERVGKNLVDFDEDYHQQIYNGGLEYDVNLLPTLGFVLGYGHSFLDKESGPSDDGSLFLTGAKWQIRPDTFLRATVARKLRFPSLLQLYDVDKGSSDLEAEHSWDYQVGIGHDLPCASRLEVTGFWIDVDDYIEEDEATEHYANMDQYRFRGVEVALHSQPFERLGLRASYTFMDSENRSPDSDFDDLQNRPRHQFQFESRYQLPHGFALRGAVRVSADQVVLSRTGPARTRQVGDSVTGDLRLAKTLFEDHLLLYFGVDNVADADDQESYGVPAPGRVFYGGFEGRF